MSTDYVAKNHLHAGYSHPVSREIQSAGTEIGSHNLMWPIFLVDKPNDRQDIDSMPGKKCVEHILQ